MRTRIVNRNANPLLLDLPDWLEKYEPHQIKAISEILAAFQEVDVVWLDAPTGTGKTLIGETVRLLMELRGLYICSSLGLQDQFLKDFPYAKVVKGRRNYRTEQYPSRWPFVSCDDCVWDQDSPSCPLCRTKRLCPYEKAKSEAILADCAVLNSAYALTEWNGPRKFSGRELVIIDEADIFENAVIGFVSVEISGKRMAELGWKPPKRVTKLDAWLAWFDEYIPKAQALAETTKDEREKKSYTRLASQMSKVNKHLVDGMPYAFTGHGAGVGFKPAFVGDYCQEMVWRHGRKWLLMSATTISSEERLESLGYYGEHRLVRVESTFPVKNRLVHVRPVANMGRNNKDANIDGLVREIQRLVMAEPGRIVIHTVSYSLAGDICRGLEGSGRRVVTYRLASERAAALSEYVRTPGSILVAPSADRGVDLPDDLCRLVIIAKIPFPNLGDRMVSMRLHMPGVDGQLWYTAETVRTIVQMAGRGVRHKGDYCKTVILDNQFASGVWSRGKTLFPKWFREAIIWEKT